REAEPILEQCSRLRPDSPDPLIGLAACAVERREFERAAGFLAAALELDPGSTRALNDLASVHLMRKDYESAIVILERILRLDKNDKSAALKLAQALRYTGASARAKELERKYQVLDKEEEKQSGHGRPSR